MGPLRLLAPTLVAVIVMLGALAPAAAGTGDCRSLVLVIDASSSVAPGYAYEKALLDRLASLVDPGTPIAVVVFASNVYYEAVGPARQVLRGALTAIDAAEKRGTNLYAALEAALAFAEKAGCKPLVVLVTDGYPTAGVVDDKSIKTLVAELEKLGAEIIAYTPTGAASKLLEEITSGRVYSLDPTTAEQLASTAGAAAATPDSDGDGLPDSLEEALAETYLPIMVFDNDESMYPSPVNYYYTDIGFYRGKGEELLATSITPPLLRQAAPAPWIDPGDGYEYYIDKFNDGIPSEEAIEHHYPYTPYRYNYTVYYEVAPIGSDRVMVSYWFFYPLNNPPWGFHWLFVNINLHEGDWEHIAIVLEKNGDTYAPVTVYYCPHEWVEKYSWSEVEKYGTHIVVAVGRGSHANYRVTQVPFFEDNGLNGLVLVPQGLDVEEVLSYLEESYGVEPSGADTWKTLVNLGEPTNYTRAYETIIGEEPPVRLDYTSPSSPDTLFLDSKAVWGVWASALLSFASSGAPQPAMHKDFYNPEKKTVAPISAILNKYGDYNLAALVLGLDYTGASKLLAVRGERAGLYLPS